MKKDWNLCVDGKGFWNQLIGILIVVDALLVVALATLAGLRVTVRVEDESCGGEVAKGKR